MNKYYLRVEGVNFNYFIYDTDKIQPMRGGSYLLLEAINSLVGFKINGIQLNKIMTGASIGLFSFELDDKSRVDGIIDEVRKKLSKETGGYATFVVSALEATNDFKRDIEMITAMNRWQQFQQPTLVLPANESSDKCFYDGVRPGFNTDTPEGKKPVSDSVSFRINKGRKLRQNIYSRILGIQDFKESFVDNLEELTNADEDSQLRHDNLNHKMALIYFDGNRFTKIREEKCTDEETLTAFSECVEVCRKDFLDKLIQKAQAEQDFKNNGNIRLETLLWGGDEFEIIVPAWKGWETLRLFYKCMSSAKFNDIQLTHAGGIIFSNHKAPIRQVRNMARKLADMAKRSLPSGFAALNHNKHDIARYLIMESFDTVGPDVEHFVNQYYGVGYYNDFTLTPPVMDAVTEALSLMKRNGFPHNKIFEIIQIIKTYTGSDWERKIDAVFEKALSEVEDRENVCNAINKVIDDKYHRWLMLADLWDYVGG